MEYFTAAVAAAVITLDQLLELELTVAETVEPHLHFQMVRMPFLIEVQAGVAVHQQVLILMREEVLRV